MTREEKVSLSRRAARQGFRAPRHPRRSRRTERTGPNGVREAPPGDDRAPGGAVVVAAHVGPRRSRRVYGAALAPRRVEARASTRAPGPDRPTSLRVPRLGPRGRDVGRGSVPRRADRGGRDPRDPERSAVIAQVKHFAANNQGDPARRESAPGRRRFSPAVDVVRVGARAAERSTSRRSRRPCREGRRDVRDVRLSAHQRRVRVPAHGPPRRAEGRVGLHGLRRAGRARRRPRDTRAAIDAGTDNFQLGGVGASRRRRSSRRSPPSGSDDMVCRIPDGDVRRGALRSSRTTGDPGASVSTAGASGRSRPGSPQAGLRCCSRTTPARAAARRGGAIDRGRRVRRRRRDLQTIGGRVQRPCSRRAGRDAARGDHARGPGRARATVTSRGRDARRRCALDDRLPSDAPPSPSSGPGRTGCSARTTRPHGL